MHIGKSVITIFIFFMIGNGWLVNASASEKDEDTWPEVAITADDGWYNWHYEQVEPESWLLSSDGPYIAEDGTKDEGLWVITYKDATKELVYPRIIDAYNEHAEPIEAEKVDICGVSAIAITLKLSLVPHNPVMVAEYDGSLYGYERIFLNLEQERQSMQFYDHYAIDTIKGNDPIEEFLARTKFTCENGFIAFPDVEDYGHRDWSE